MRGIILQFTAMLLSTNRQCLLQYLMQIRPNVAKLDKLSLGSRTMLSSGFAALVISYFVEGEKYISRVVHSQSLMLKLMLI